ncbi:unnamed protein product [Durusdinium trenchii]|uniref:Uncharacterized protein n=2 Tax=Durusdinium trenchii TaxID=1381693 RepID=A0ABP0NJ98_9DINO
MGDEILPDEVMEIRVQMTKRYQEQPDKRRMKDEMRAASGFMFMGSARLVQGVATVIFFGILFALSQSDQDTVTFLLMPPQRRGF